jgi:hypothetical protein
MTVNIAAYKLAFINEFAGDLMPPDGADSHSLMATETNQTEYRPHKNPFPIFLKYPQVVRREASRPFGAIST